MRISDWSSDVCSSDLGSASNQALSCAVTAANGSGRRRPRGTGGLRLAVGRTSPAFQAVRKPMRNWSSDVGATSSRSEEHTSELQSLMRISYAVFCLKKKNIHTTNNTSNINILIP